MSQLIKVTVRFPYTSGLPKDVSENVWHFVATDPYSPATRAAISSRLKDFYNVGPGALSTKISDYMSAIIVRTAAVFRFAEINVATGAQIGATIEETWTLGAPANANSAPLEVALCASFRGPNSGGTLPLSSRTGRVYLGPFNSTVLTTGADPQPSASLIATMVGCSRRLVQAADTVAALCIWSRKYGAVTGPTAGWVDNEWDTQRRRGNEASNRNVWTA